MKVYCFKVRFKGDDLQEVQNRYVLAENEEKAIEKMERYAQKLEEKGFAKVYFSVTPTVELENVII